MTNKKEIKIENGERFIKIKGKWINGEDYIKMTNEKEINELKEAKQHLVTGVTLINEKNELEIKLKVREKQIKKLEEKKEEWINDWKKAIDMKHDVIKKNRKLEQQNQELRDKTVELFKELNKLLKGVKK